METHGWLCKYHPHVAEVTNHIAQLLREYAESDDGQLEFEFRLGRWTTGSAFVPDVGQVLYERLIGRSSAGCSTSGHPGAPLFCIETPQTDYWYMQTVGDTERELRTRVTYDHANLDIITNTIYKQPLGRVDIKIGDIPWGIRFDAKREVAMDIETRYNTVVPTTRCCISSKCVAVIVSQRNDGRAMWKIEATRRWDGATRSEAERKAVSGEPCVYGVEIEYVGGKAAMETCGAAYVACSGLLKALSILGREDAVCRLHRVTCARQDEVEDEVEDEDTSSRK